MQNDHKIAAKNTIKLLFKNGYHGHVIKIMAKTIISAKSVIAHKNSINRTVK